MPGNEYQKGRTDAFAVIGKISLVKTEQVGRCRVDDPFCNAFTVCSKKGVSDEKAYRFSTC